MCGKILLKILELTLGAESFVFTIVDRYLLSRGESLDTKGIGATVLH